MQYSVHEVPTDGGGVRHPVAAPGDFVAILGYPEGTNPHVRLGTPTADPIPMQLLSRVAAGKGWQQVFLDFDPAPGNIVLVIGSGLELGRFDPAVDVQSVRETPSSAIYSGELVTGAAAQPVGAQPCAEVLIRADAANVDLVMVGGVAVQALPLTPGEAVAMRVSNVSEVYVRAAAGAPRVSWLARG
jgi:hypothetical protein